jgi:hypothetical protein
MEDLYPSPNQPAAQPSDPGPGSDYDSRIRNEIPQENRFLAALKNLLVLLVLVAVIVGSFWVSFHLGRRLLVPVQKTPQQIKVAIPEPPPSIAHLQKLEDIEGITGEVRHIEVKPVTVTTVARVRPTVGYTAGSGTYYKVQAGFFKVKSNAIALAGKLRASGFESFIRKIDSGWRVQAGAFKSKKWAQDLQRSLKAKGFESVLIYE